jgi:hypothetical protein
MLTTFFPFLDPALTAPDLPEKLRKLAADLDNIRHGAIGAGVLRDAPVIDQWAALLTRAGVCLIGGIGGHPLLGDRLAITFPLWVADPKGERWVRTTSSYYRLGKPADAAAREVLEAVLGLYRDDEAEVWS